jgi:hypothetical protein
MIHSSIVLYILHFEELQKSTIEKGIRHDAPMAMIAGHLDTLS